MYKILKITIIIFLLGGCMNATEIVGKVKVKGSSPHTYLVIEDSKTHKSYKIKNADDFNLENMQNEILKLKVKVIKESIGPGFPAIVEVLNVKSK